MLLIPRVLGLHVPDNDRLKTVLLWDHITQITSAGVVKNVYNFVG